MSPKTDTTPKDDTTSESVSALLTQRTAAWDALAIIRATWSDKERLLIARLADTYSQKTTRSHVTDGHLSTLVFERQSRVAAQLPSGKIYALTSKDDGAATLMNLVLEKYIMPNANSQFDMLTKLRMSGVYASVYGAQPMLYDYRIDDEYIGPDVYLVPVRNFMPQPGKNSIRDCDWVMISTTVSVSYLESIVARKNTKWNKANINKLIAMLKDGATPSKDLNSGKKSAVENVRTNGQTFPGKGSTARLELITKYEKGVKGKWITFAPDYPDVGELRNISNPHNNGRIPIVMRQCFPLVDSIFGLGDFERGMTLQKAKDSLINLYLDAVKLSIFPPLKVDLTGVTASTIKMQAGARWLMSDMNAVQAFEANPQGMETFQGTYQFLTSALLNQNGTTDTSTSATDSGNPAFGKTPQALEQLQQRENARDNWDRFMLEKSWEELINGIVNLVGENQEAPINFHIFDEDIKEIEEQYKDEDMKFMTKVNSSVSKVVLPKKMLQGKYKFAVDASSSMTNDQKAENEQINQLVGFYLQAPQVVDQMLMKDNMTFNFGELVKRMVITSGIQDWDEILEEHDGDEAGEGQQQMPPDMQAKLAGIQDPHVQAVAQQLFGQQGQPQGQPQPQMPMSQNIQQPAQPQMPQPLGAQ